MDLIEVGNVSTASAAYAGHVDEAALLRRSIEENTISFQQGRSMVKMGDSLRRYARRSSGQELHDYNVLSGLLPDSDVLATLPTCLAPAAYRRFCTGSLRDCVRSPGDLQKLADMFCDGDCARAAQIIDSDEAQMELPLEFRLPSQRSLCDPLKQSLILCDPGKAEGDGSPANDGRRRDVHDKTSPVLVSSPLPKSIWSEKGDVDDDAEDEASPEYFGPFAILYELFSVPQLFEAGARALYLSLGADEANGAPSVAAVTGMLSKLHGPALR
jgi:hypothetical protein